jgi:hypothetical protein
MSAIFIVGLAAIAGVARRIWIRSLALPHHLARSRDRKILHWSAMTFLAVVLLALTAIATRASTE